MIWKPEMVTMEVNGAYFRDYSKGIEGVQSNREES